MTQSKSWEEDTWEEDQYRRALEPLTGPDLGPARRRLPGREPWHA
jgi:hypothetical protein